MLRNAKKLNKQTKHQSSNTTTKTQKRKTPTKTLKKQTKRSLHIKPTINATTSAITIPSLTSTTRSIMPTNQKKTFSTTTGSKNPTHEAGFDIIMGKLDSALNNNQIDARDLLKEQHKAIAGFETRQWELKDTLAVLPHFLQLLQPTSPVMNLAIHRLTNLRAKLKKENAERFAEGKADAKYMEQFEEDELKLKIFLNQTSVDMVSVTELLRSQSQILHTAAQMVKLPYQNYCRNNFGNEFDSAALYNTLLEHMDTVPQLSFYRMHYQQILFQMSCTMVNKPPVQLLEHMQSITDDRMQAIFLKRFSFIRSQAFKETLRTHFKASNVLNDSTQLALNHNDNLTKSSILGQLITDAFNNFTIDAGITGDALGHYLLENELSFGLRFPREPKRILRVMNLYTISKIAKMPQNQENLTEYTRVINAIQLPDELIREVMSVVGTEQEQDQLLQQQRLDSTNFISFLVETPANLPEELAPVPLMRDTRAQFFHQYPHAHAAWSSYNQLINTVTQVDRDQKVVTTLNKENIVLEKAHLTAKNDVERERLDQLLDSNRKRITTLTSNINQNHKHIEKQVDEYQTKAEPWKVELKELETKGRENDRKQFLQQRETAKQQ